MIFTLMDPLLTILGSAACLGLTAESLKWLASTLETTVFDEKKALATTGGFEHQKVIATLARTGLQMLMWTPHSSRHKAQLGQAVAIFVCCDGNHHLNQLKIVRRVLRNRGVRVAVIVVDNKAKVPFDVEDGDEPMIVRVYQTCGTGGKNGELQSDFDLTYGLITRDVLEVRSRAPEVERILDEQGVGVIVNLFSPTGMLYHLATNGRRPIVNISTHYRLQPHVCGFGQYLEIMRFGRVCPLAPVDNEGHTVIPPMVLTKEFVEPDLDDLEEDFFLCYATNNSVLDALLKAAESIDRKFYIFLNFDVENPLENPLDHVECRRVPDPHFKKLLGRCKGVVTTGGNGVVWEAVTLSKPVVTIPIPDHIEQILSAKYNSSRFEGVRACLSLDDVADSLQWLVDPDFDQSEYNKQVRNLRSFIGQMELRLAEAILDHV
uniref:Glycosyl transferase family 28 C-terminal domain-containing protein n=1 Tax=Phaeomonas parva TaxID=124430 RepID=A0A6U4I1U5_9STRA|mmetsp:Transcript_385/g.979  ORF Transcript_385/g.979 Transcript_385/m.979 type:complete len:434 (+) Transcript_385:269-1570(+)